MIRWIAIVAIVLLLVWLLFAPISRQTTNFPSEHLHATLPTQFVLNPHPAGLDLPASFATFQPDKGEDIIVLFKLPGKHFAGSSDLEKVKSVTSWLLQKGTRDWMPTLIRKDGHLGGQFLGRDPQDPHLYYLVKVWDVESYGLYGIQAEIRSPRLAGDMDLNFD